MSRSIRLAAIGDQWRLIWQRVTHRLDVIGKRMDQWTSFRLDIDKLLRRLAEIANSIPSTGDSVMSIQAKRDLHDRLKVGAVQNTSVGKKP